MELTAKTPLQLRAETAAQKFKTKARHPIVIEFAGMPKSGKTTTLGAIHGFLKRCGFRVETVIEMASICPIRDKHHFNFNIWTACMSLVQLLEKTQAPSKPGDLGPEILILDRGIFDALSWMSSMEKKGHLRTEERKVIEDFLLIKDWRTRIAGVVVLQADPEDAMKRESSLLPVLTTGSIMNPEAIAQMKANTNQCIERFRNKFNIQVVDTSSSLNSTPAGTAHQVADIVLSLIENQLEEEIFSIKKSEFLLACGHQESTAQPTQFVLKTVQAQNLITAFKNYGEFGNREVVESDFERIQALPVVVIRNKSGHVLQLKRKESNPKNPLHEKFVIWAGGHVRKEDSANGNTLKMCAIRELQEELRLRVEPEELNLVGVVYSAHNASVGKHVAIVYEWFAKTDDVNIVLNFAEFFERRGASQSGKFIGMSDLTKCVDEEKVVEHWSVQIAKELLTDNPTIDVEQPTLFE